MISGKGNKESRFVSRLTRDTLALILAGGRGSRLKQLTTWRAKPAVPFGGKFRIIDFPLSNCLNSDIRRIGVLTQYKSHSLLQHIQRGWSFLRGEFGEFVELMPAQQRIQESWYAGTADAVYQNLDILRTHDPKYVLILAGDHIYKMDYGPMLAHHADHNADMTVGCIEVPLEEASAFGVMTVDNNCRVKEFSEKPAKPDPIPGRDDTALVSMGIYVFNTEFLFSQLINDADIPSSSHDFGMNIIPAAIDLYDDEWPIWTYQEQLPPAKFIFNDKDRRGLAVDSMVSGGCIISGSEVKHSLLFSNVRIGSYSHIEDSVILPEVKVGRQCKLKKVIIDKGCNIPDGTVVGEDPEEDAKRFHVSPNGVVLITPEMLDQNLHHVR
jgi:glucose-1-phosphate adenylyltransferase